MKMNNFGSSLIWGHPQGPMGLRGVIELIEELVNERRRLWPVYRLCGGGYRHGYRDSGL